MLHLLHRSKYRWKSAALIEQTDTLQNPERGFYSIVRFDAASGQTPEEHLCAEDLILPTDQTLVLVEISLYAFSTSPLSDEALDHVDHILSILETRGMDLILRFLYDWDGRGFETEPSELSQILEHMDQLSPLLHTHADHIFTMQGLFTGSWGEMHHTRYATAYAMKCLYDRLSEATASQTFLAVRCPNLWRNIFRTFTPDANAGGTRCRLGLFNDAITASETDMGTYGDIERSTALRWDEKFRREDELQFQKKLCLFVPNGGEVLLPNTYNDLPTAISTFRTMHLTYLNRAYDASVLNKWKQTVVQQPGSVWDQKNGYDYIAAHLGYRYLIRRCHVRFSKEIMHLQLVVENTGFAPYYRHINAGITFTSITEQHTLQFPLSMDIRTWMPGKRYPFTRSIPLAEVPRGSYRILLSLKSTVTGKPIRFANTALSPCGESENWIGDLSIC